MQKIIIFALCTTILFQTACGSKSQTGGAIGGATGAVIGASVADDNPLLGALFGAAIGGLIGSSIGAQLDENDKRYMQQTTIVALNNNRGYEWVNQNTGNHGAIRPISTSYDSERRQHCREYVQTIVVGGKEEEGYGKACLQPDGNWKIVS